MPSDERQHDLTLDQVGLIERKRCLLAVEGFRRLAGIIKLNGPIPSLDLWDDEDE